MHSRISLLLAGTAWALPSAAIAQEANGATGEAASEREPAITVTATLLPTDVDDVPATVTVIDDENIADMLATDIRELVRFEPGVTVRQAPARFGAASGTTGRAGAEGFTIRGIGGNRVLIQVDGIRVPEGFAFGGQDVGRGDYVDLGLVRSVEILRGPTSALYGSDGLAGAVSFILADPKDVLDSGQEVGGRARVTYDSSDDEFSESLLVAGQNGTLSALVAYTRRDGNELETQGEVGGEGQTRTIANPQDTQSNSVLGRLVWEPTVFDRFRVTGEYQESGVLTNVLSGRVTSAFTGAATLDLRADDSTERMRVSADYRRIFDGTLDEFNLRAWYQDSESRQFAFEERSPQASRERLNTFLNEIYGASADLFASFDTGGLGHRIVLGGDISLTKQSGVRDGTIPPTGEVFPTAAFPQTDFLLAGLFVADEISVADGRLTLFPALRFDHYDLDPDNDPLLPETFTGAAQDGSRVSPKLGVVFDVGGGFSLYGNYAQGFRAPQPTQINQFFENVIFGYTSLPNPDLGPETSESFEAGLRFESEGLRIGVAGFRANYDDFISQQQTGGSFTPFDPAVFQFVNLDEVQISGAEGRLSYAADFGLTLNLALAYADGDVTTGGVDTPLETIDPFNAVAGIGWQSPGNRFGFQLIGTYSARKSIEDIPASLCSAECFRPDDFVVVDLTAHARLSEAFTLRAGVFNLLDEKYAWWSDARGVPATVTGLGQMGPMSVPNPELDAYTRPGRNVSVSLTARF